MKIRTFAFSIILILTITNGIAQIDTLNSVFEFNAPSENPWGLAHDGEYLWISDSQNETIYNVTTTGEIIDSITISNSIIKGIEIVDDTLWVLNSKIIGDTIINDLSYPLFSIYQIDNSSGFILDSIIIVSLYTNLQSGDLWGLCYNSTFFYISFNGGYGPCLIKIDPINNTQQYLCCTHLSGLTSIEDSVWAIRNGRTIVTTDGQEDFSEYKINIYASDLVYDGSSFWVVDFNSNKIHQLESVVVSINETIQTGVGINIYPIPASDYLQFKITPTFIDKLELFDSQGKKIKTIYLNKNISNYKMNISGVKSGIYILKIYTQTESFKEKVIVNNNR